MPEVIRISRGTGGGGGITPTGILYKTPDLTGQVVSYRTGDDGWHFQNGTYNYIRPTNPLIFAELDQSALVPFITLKQPNAFGNLGRFTDINGLQVYPTAYVIDHLTRLGWYRDTFTLAIDWNGYIDFANAASYFGFSDWRMPNKNEGDSILDLGQVHLTDSPALLPMLNSGVLWSSTTHFNAPVNAYEYQVVSKYRCDIRIKTQANRRTYLCRNHY